MGALIELDSFGLTPALKDSESMLLAGKQQVWPANVLTGICVRSLDPSDGVLEDLSSNTKHVILGLGLLAR